ncbi:unnamed protein product [Lupinus luteus]|uniref:R13L1/DRL21-like LRR repeat region domain-containing protein n=1 Tax=Lupinus luteus TaxID=3873 RepID=A0AAV1WGY3_LUPLU
MADNKYDEVKERTRHLSHLIIDGSSYLNVKDVAKVFEGVISSGDTYLKWMPLKMNALRNLQKLSDFFVGEDCGSSIGELGEISNLHETFSIHRLENIVILRDSENAKLKEKNCIEKLCLDWSGSGDTDNS